VTARTLRRIARGRGDPFRSPPAAHLPTKSSGCCVRFVMCAR
jgi:hypothetical protein